MIESKTVMNRTLLRSFCSGVLFLALAHPVSAQVADRGFADLAKKVSPGVVNISTFARPRLQRPGPPGGFPGLFEEFFGGRLPPQWREEPLPPPSKKSKPLPYSLGTGFVIDESGFILTNYHVIQGAEEVKIQFDEDEESVPAEIVGRDPELDVALLSVKTKEKTIALPLGDSDRIEVGEPVLAIGNPLGYGHSVTHGILSAKERKAPEMRLAKYLQTDASINPGNSGGPLINMKGEVIGINNAIDARGQGIGFAIPINSVKQILGQLKSKGSVSRGYLGVSVGEVTPDLAEQLKLPKGTKGVLIAEVLPGQAAAKAGILPYDVITSVNREKVSSPIDLTTRITAIPVGEAAELVLIRKGEEKKISLKVGERPVESFAGGPKKESPKGSKDNKKIESAFAVWGFECVERSEANAKEFGLPLKEVESSSGVILSDLAYGKPAAESGLARGDLIIDIGGIEVSTVAQAEAAVKKAGSQSLMMRIRRYNPNGDSAVIIVILKPGA